MGHAKEVRRIVDEFRRLSQAAVAQHLRLQDLFRGIACESHASALNGRCFVFALQGAKQTTTNRQILKSPVNHGIGIDLEQVASWFCEEEYEHALDNRATILDAEQSLFLVKVNVVLLSKNWKARIRIAVRP